MIERDIRVSRDFWSTVIKTKDKGLRGRSITAEFAVGSVRTRTSLTAEPEKSQLKAAVTPRDSSEPLEVRQERTASCKSKCGRGLRKYRTFVFHETGSSSPSIISTEPWPSAGFYICAWFLRVKAPREVPEGVNPPGRRKSPNDGRNSAEKAFFRVHGLRKLAETGGGPPRGFP